MSIKYVLVTVTRFRELCADSVNQLESAGFKLITPILEFPRLEKRALLEIIPEMDAAIAGLDSWTQEIFSAAPKLKVVSRFGLGVDNIDLDAATKHNVVICNARGSYHAVAELALAMMLNMLRDIPRLNQTTKQGQWERYIGHELNGKVIGFLGFGKIPQTLARKLGGFDVKMLAYDKYPDQEQAKNLGVSLCSEVEVISSSDILSLHLPACLETVGHINYTNVFSRMKQGSYFLNTARGSLVNEIDLLNALTDGTLQGAASDVFCEEPVDKDNPLLALPNFICTPHQGAETFATMERVGAIAAQAILDVFAGKRPQSQLN